MLHFGETSYFGDADYFGDVSYFGIGGDEGEIPVSTVGALCFRDESLTILAMTDESLLIC